MATPASSTPLSIRDRLASMAVLVAVTKPGETVGTVAWQVVGPEEGHLRGMAVLPAHAGTGVAEQLLTAAERALRDRGCIRVSLDTTEPLQAPSASTRSTATGRRAGSATSSACRSSSTSRSWRSVADARAAVWR